MCTINRGALAASIRIQSSLLKSSVKQNSSRISGRCTTHLAKPPDKSTDTIDVHQTEDNKDQEITANRAIIYTDGACSGNGKPDSKAGIGVYWPHDQRNNISRRIDGKQTSQRAELKAAIEGINQATDQGYSSVTLRTDSKYVKNSAESWIPKWEEAGWSKPLSNYQEFRQLQSAMGNIDVKFEYVPTEQNHADSLAKQATRTDYEQ